MSKIAIQCHECGHAAKVPAEFAGKRVRCLKCQTKLTVPQAERGGSGRRATAEKAEAGRRPASGRDQASGRRTGSGRDQGSGRRSTNTAEKEERRSSNNGSPGPARGAAEQRPRRSPSAARSTLAPEARQAAQAAIRELLEEYEFAIEQDERGFVVDVRGVTFGLARTLVEEILEDVPGVRDVRLAGGTGEVRLNVILKGSSFNSDDSFADEEEETEIYHRKGLPQGNVDLDAIVANAVTGRLAQDPVQGLMEDAARQAPVMDSMRSIVPDTSTRGGSPPESIESIIAKGRQLVANGSPEAAIQLLERAVRIDKDHPEAVFDLATAYASVGEYDRARRAFRHFSRLRPDDAEGHVMHAAASVACDRLEDARAALVQAIRLDQNNAKAYRYAAKLYERLGDPVKAAQFKERYRQLKSR